jgi:hypothetical protein
VKLIFVLIGTILVSSALYNTITFIQKDRTAPLWKSQGQNTTSIQQDEGILLYAQVYDETEFKQALLSTNETGRWENRTVQPEYMKTEAGWVLSSFLWQNPSVQPNSTVAWFIWFEDSSGNWNRTDIMSFDVRPITECRIAIDLSPELRDGVRFQIDPGKTVDALGNNGTGPTGYWVDVFVMNCVPNGVDLYIKADEMVFDDFIIPLSNFKMKYSITDSTVSAAPLKNMAADYLHGQVGANLQNGTRVYLKFQLSVPEGQRAGEYTNVIHIKGTKTGVLP